MKVESHKKGFTIIEVVLVLAIAGLIFLMVFIALPALQRGQRDTQRRDDMARVLSQVSQYQANNGGKIPDEDSFQRFFKDYLKWGEGGEFNDPDTGNPYDVIYRLCQSSACEIPSDAKVSQVYYLYHAHCDGEEPKYDSGNRKMAIVTKLEGSGTYCSNN